MSDFRKHIRRHIRKNSQKTPQASNEQAIILAGLNVMQVLEDNASKYLKTLLHYGPSSFIGKNWASVLIWHRRRGYQNYKNLTLFGVWAIVDNDSTKLFIANKPLQYRAVIYNPESYNTVIKRSFKAYYDDDGSLPDRSRIVYETEFDITRRLALRRELEIELIIWLRHTLIQF